MIETLVKSPLALDKALAAVIEERIAQDAKWGEQNHANVDPVLMNRPGGCTVQRMAEEYEIPTASRARTNCEIEFARGRGTWAHILIEELAEAIEAAVLAPTEGVGNLRTELVQVAAVCVAWIEAINRKAVNDFADPPAGARGESRELRTEPGAGSDLPA